MKCSNKILTLCTLFSFQWLLWAGNTFESIIPSLNIEYPDFLSKYDPRPG